MSTTLTTAKPASLSLHEDAITSTPQPPPEKAHRLKFIYLMLGLYAAIFFLAMDTSIVATAIPSITNRFDSVKDIGWYGSAYLLANCTLQPLAGQLYTLYPTKHTFLTFLVLFELGSLLCGAAASSNMFIVGRAVAGTGGAGLLNGAMTIVSVTTTVRQRPLYAGAGMSAFAVGQVVGPLVGGAFATGVSWRWCFFINPPFGLLTGLALFMLPIPDALPKASTPRACLTALRALDTPGFLLFAPTITTALLALEWGGTVHAWSSPTIIALFATSALTLLLFLAWEAHRGPTAMLPPSLLRTPPLAAACATGVALFGGLLVVTYYLPLYFQSVRGASAVGSGVRVLPLMGAQVAGSAVGALLASRTGRYAPWTMGGAALAAVGAGLMSTFTPATGAGKWVGYEIVVGVGRGMAIQMPSTAAQSTLPPPLLATGTAAVIFAQFFGGAVFVALAETVFAARLGPALARWAPGVSAGAVVAAGAGDWRSVVPAAQVEGVVRAYCQAIGQVFYLAVGAAGVAVVAGAGLGWGRVREDGRRGEGEGEGQEGETKGESEGKKA